MKEAKELIEKYEKGLCTPDEIKLLQEWFHQLGENDTSALTEQDLLIAKNRFSQYAERYVERGRWRRKWRRMGAAASLILMACMGLYFYLISPQNGPEPVLTATVGEPHDVAPGTNKAMITLPNGHSFYLGDTDLGAIVREGGMAVSRTAEGTLVYEVIDAEELNSHAGAYTTIETPRGAQHQVLLPDGSRIWLNAASSLRFPATFSVLEERVVELSGEAYFEVARDETRPFIVKSEGQEVRVLGTSFNINSYRDEGGTKTTLLEGSVEISHTAGPGKGKKPVMLLPGEQALLTQDGLRVNQVGGQQAIDWKNGDFVFQQESLAQILRRVGRWYDVDIVYDPKVDKVQTFSGQVSRHKNLSEVLMILEAAGEVQFVIIEKRVIASKQ